MGGVRGTRARPAARTLRKCEGDDDGFLTELAPPVAPASSSRSLVRRADKLFGGLVVGRPRGRLRGCPHRRVEWAHVPSYCPQGRRSTQIRTVGSRKSGRSRSRKSGRPLKGQKNGAKRK